MFKNILSSFDSIKFSTHTSVHQASRHESNDRIQIVRSFFIITQDHTRFSHAEGKSRKNLLSFLKSTPIRRIQEARGKGFSIVFRFNAPCDKLPLCFFVDRKSPTEFYLSRFFPRRGLIRRVNHEKSRCTHTYPFFIIQTASGHGECLFPPSLPSYGRMLMVFNTGMTNTPYLAIFIRADHVSFRWLDYSDYLVSEKYRFRRLTVRNLPLTILSRGIKLLSNDGN